jgi:uncharacterized protein YkwD
MWKEQHIRKEPIMFRYAMQSISHKHQFQAHPSRKPVVAQRAIAGMMALAALAALLLVLALPGGHVAAKTLQPQDQISTLEQQMFTLINNDRAARGLPAYAWNATLAGGARAHSNLMASGCGLQHQCPGEPAPGTRITNEGVHWTSWGENIGYAGGYGSYSNDIQVIEKSMINEGPSGYHYKNLMSTSFKEVGVGVSIDSKGYVWVTEDFVQP